MLYLLKFPKIQFNYGKTKICKFELRRSFISLKYPNDVFQNKENIHFKKYIYSNFKNSIQLSQTCKISTKKNYKNL